VSQEFQAFILDLLAPLNPVARRMFSGVGLFRDGVMFGLLARDSMHLRVDARSRERFEAAGSAPFTYNRAGRTVSIESYYALPDGLLDQPDELQDWARDAIGAALAAHKPKRKGGTSCRSSRSPTKSRPPPPSSR
jgi:DNA transformation protein